MNVAQAVNPGAVTFSGPVSHEMHQPVGNSLNAMAHKMAAYFMANMDSDTFVNDQAHSANLSAKAGLGNASMNFAFVTPDAGHKTPAAAPNAADKGSIQI